MYINDDFAHQSPIELFLSLCPQPASFLCFHTQQSIWSGWAYLVCCLHYVQISGFVNTGTVQHLVCCLHYVQISGFGNTDLSRKAHLYSNSVPLLIFMITEPHKLFQKQKWIITLWRKHDDPLKCNVFIQTILNADCIVVVDGIHSACLLF